MMRKKGLVLTAILIVQVYSIQITSLAQTPTFDPTRNDGFTGAIRQYTTLPDGTVVRRLTVPKDEYIPLLISRVVGIENAERQAAGRGRLDPNMITALSQIPPEEVVAIVVRLAQSDNDQDRALASPLTGAVVIASLLLVRDLIDSTLNQVDAIASNALWAMRAHIAATMADMEVVFKRQMDTLFEKLDIQLQKMLIAARDLAYQTQVSLADLEQKGYEHASDLLCQAAIAAANFQLIHISLLPRRERPPDIVCMTVPWIRDSGLNHDQFLAFRGINLRPKGQYPDVTLSIPRAGKTLELAAAGGSSLTQVSLPGGINGGPNDPTPRGNAIVEARFDWRTSKDNSDRLQSRWLFLLKPYIVSSIEVSITPAVTEASIRERASEPKYISANKGKEEHTSWVMTKSGDADYLTDCWYAENTKAENSGIEDKIFTPGGGSCEYKVVARGGSWPFGGHGWFGITMFIRERVSVETFGPTYFERFILNQGQTSKVINYDLSLLKPPIVDRNFSNGSWEITITRNTGEVFVLTNTHPSDPRIGIAAMDPNPRAGKLTLTLANAL